MTRLHDLGDGIRAIEDAMEANDDDDPTAWRMAAAEVRGEFRQKAVGIALLLQEWKAEASAVQAEADRLAARASAVNNRHARLKEYLFGEMQATGLTSIKGDLVSLRIQSSPMAVAIPDPLALPSNFVRTTLMMPTNAVPETLLEYVTSEAPDKKAIKVALDAGDEVPGATLHQGQHLVVR
jgi:hypothetical protein